MEHTIIKNLKEKNMTELTEFFDLPIVFHRSFVSFAGVTGALLLSQMCYWSKRTQHTEQWFWKTQEQWQEETGLTRYEQETARKRLVSCGAISEKKEGIPCKIWFKVNHERIFELIKSNKLACGNPASSGDGIQQAVVMESNIHTITEITTEITTDNIYKPNFDLSDQIKKTNKKHDEILSNPKTSDLSAIESFGAENDVSAHPVNLNSTTATETALKSVSSDKRTRAKKIGVEIDVDMIFSDELLLAARHIYDQANVSKTDQQISLAFLDFKTHHAKKGTQYKNWVAAWKNWVVNDIKFSSKHKAESVKRDILYVEPNLYKPEGGMFANETEKNEYYKKVREKQEQILDHVTDDELDRFCGVLK